jgi:hypothetical protein
MRRNRALWYLSLSRLAPTADFSLSKAKDLSEGATVYKKYAGYVPYTGWHRNVPLRCIQSSVSFADSSFQKEPLVRKKQGFALSLPQSASADSSLLRGSRRSKK